MKTYYYKSLVIILILMTNSCKLELEPTDKLTPINLFSKVEGVQNATTGNYGALKDILNFEGQLDQRNTYVRHLYQMSEFPSDNVMISGSTSDNLYISFTRSHFPQMKNSTYMWYVGYKIILGTNLVIENTKTGESSAKDQLIGENYFLRAMVQFDLLRFFANVPSQGKDKPGIILKASSSDPAIAARSTVAESYNQVIADLLKAAELMNNSRGVEYASKEAAWAMLSRVYLYNENFDKSVEYANKLISGGRFQLATRANYVDNFHNTPKSTESIFIIKHNVQDDRGFGSLGSMYLTDQALGWGEVYISETYKKLLDKNPEDIRNRLIKPDLDASGQIRFRNVIYPKYFITKFSYQDGVVTLTSPQYLRLSEVYLNRAESNAKLGKVADAIADLNIIRTRAGLTGNKLYSASNTTSSNIMDAVLEERRLELAFEGHRAYDLYRNNKDTDRSFPGLHLLTGQTKQVIKSNDPRNIYLLPLGELQINPKCVQNP